jgi:hypothetical protein
LGIGNAAEIRHRDQHDESHQEEDHHDFEEGEAGRVT